MATTYDSRVYDLAELFLLDEKGLGTHAARHHLALHIQEALESEIQWMRDHWGKQTVNGRVQNDNKES